MMRRFRTAASSSAVLFSSAPSSHHQYTALHGNTAAAVGRLQSSSSSSGSGDKQQQQQQSDSSSSSSSRRSPVSPAVRSKAAAEALRRAAQFNTGETVRRQVMEGAAPGTSPADLLKQERAKHEQESKPPEEIDPKRTGFNVIDPNLHSEEFLGFMKKEDENAAKPGNGDRLPCEEVEGAGGGGGGVPAGGGGGGSQTKTTAAKSDPSRLEDPRKKGILDTAGIPRAGQDGSAQDATAAATKAPNWQDKKKLWKSLKQKQTDFLNENYDIPAVTELEYMRIAKELKEEDRFHWRIGQIAFEDEQLRDDYYALHLLSLKLNKCRWYMMDIQNKKGVSTTAIGMRGLFWKESCHAIIDAGRMTRGQFVDSHPILRPFGEVMQRHNLTKPFCRGFVDARLKVMSQPANIKQLYDHFDRFHGHFLCMQLEMMGIKSEVAEHIMIHLGRAIGITQHCVMLWRHYARFGTTMLPADICAANHVNLSLLRNLRLASMDTCVRRVLFEVMNHVRYEMKHVQDLVALYPTAAWPLLIEAFYPNYYLNFLEHFQFDITKRMADQHQYTYGFYWFMNKQMVRWSRTKDLSVLVDSSAPALLSPKMWSTSSTVDAEKVEAAKKVHKECENWEEKNQMAA